MKSPFYITNHFPISRFHREDHGGESEAADVHVEEIEEGPGQVVTHRHRDGHRLRGARSHWHLVTSVLHRGLQGTSGVVRLGWSGKAGLGTSAKHNERRGECTMSQQAATSTAAAISWL